MTKAELQADLTEVLIAAYGDRLSDDDIKEISAYSFETFEALGAIDTRVVVASEVINGD